MARLANPLVYELLDIADELVVLRPRPNARKAAFRRAGSTAYYGLFHALCYVCAAELVGWSKSDILESIYRSLDHGATRTKLTSPEAKIIHPSLDKIGNIFRNLQLKRHEADYKPPSYSPSRKETLDLIVQAREAVELLERLDRPARLQLAILLIARPRTA